MSLYVPSQVEDAVAMDKMPDVTGPSSDVAMDPVRLFTFMAYLAIGGTERQILNIRGGLDPRRFTQHLGCFGRFDDQLSVDMREIPAQIYRIRKLYGIHAFKELVRLSLYLKKHRIDIMHAYNFYANVFAVPAARLAGVPVVLASCRDTGEYWTVRQRRVNKYVCRFADGVIVNAEAIKSALIAEGYAAERIIVIHNGIHCRALPSSAEKKAIRHTLNVPAEGPLIGVVARIARLKGIEYFVQAARVVLDRVPNARFLVMGDTSVDFDYRKELKQLTARLGLQDRLTFTGFRLDVPELLPALTVSVLPSISGEGLSNSLLESMAAGVPVVATHIGGNLEVVVDGVTGLLVPPENSTELARAICRVIETPDLAAAMGRAGRERVLDYFGNDRMIENTQRVYQDLLEQVRRRERDHPLHTG
ncbi:MAG: GT4 family glycosyltransferase PelF [Nitrospirae bacterium]|nr:GT4 family glycosyltransferase PelF [Nitrospirota bacterium]